MDNRRLMLNTLRQFEYLLRMINEGQKKSVAEWTALVRMALLEVDEAIGKGVIMFDDESMDFRSYQKFMERVATDLELAKRAQPLKAPVIAHRKTD